MAQTQTTNLVSQVYNAPTPIYEYSQPTIYIIKANYLTIKVKHIDVPISYVHDQYFLLTVDPVKIKTIIHPEDISTKS